MHHRRKLRIYTEFLTLRRPAAPQYAGFLGVPKKCEGVSRVLALLHSLSFPFHFVFVRGSWRTEIRVDGFLTELASKHARTSASIFASFRKIPRRFRFIKSFERARNVQLSLLIVSRLFDVFGINFFHHENSTLLLFVTSAIVNINGDRVSNKLFLKTNWKMWKIKTWKFCLKRIICCLEYIKAESHYIHALACVETKRYCTS